MVVYWDTLVLLNLVLDYLLLLLTGRVAGAALCRWRILLGSLLGALYAGSIFWPGWPFLSHGLVRLCCGVMMVLIAYGHQRRLWKLTVVFFALSATLGGGLYALQLLGGGTVALDLRYVLLFAAVAYGVLSLFGRRLARHGPRELKPVVVRLGDRCAHLTALVDSGNTLTDPMTGKGVMVAEGQSLAPLLPPEADFSQPCQCFADLSEPQRFRLLPYRAVGVDQGLLLAVRADGVTVAGRELGPRLVALSPTPVSDGGGYHALIFEE